LYSYDNMLISVFDNLTSYHHLITLHYKYWIWNFQEDNQYVLYHNGFKIIKIKNSTYYCPLIKKQWSANEDNDLSDFSNVLKWKEKIYL
jgi:uncharacterized protein (UPF0305 family)